jgi:Protein of unknown function (DUF1579)
MADDQDAQAMQLPRPDPALQRLERFVGTWQVTGRTLGSGEDNVSGRFTFEWLPGGFFLQQRTELNFAGYEVKGLEVIGYDPATGKFPSTVYSSMAGVPIPYEYDVQGDRVTIRTSSTAGRPTPAASAPTASPGRAAGGRTPARGPATSPTTSL